MIRERLVAFVFMAGLVGACSPETKKEEKVTQEVPVAAVETTVTSDTVTLPASSQPQQLQQENLSGPRKAMHAEEPGKITPPSDPFKGSTFTAEVINSEIGWGYDLYIDGKKTIHQPHIPGVSGMKGFDTKEKAEKTANFVLFKLKNNIMPPSVSKEELDSLGVLK
ncbi:MAG: hypothetical protein K0R51_2556 [Cytophagaceae bacterium]|jgi:hypothetical protein|nr:hypothetical protein [Cytophagaceae bacterium]